MDELGLFHNFVSDTITRAKRPFDVLEESQPLQSAAKKLCHLSHCSTPCPSKKLPWSSPDSAPFLGFSGCLDETELENTVIRESLPECSVVALSVDTTRCFDDSEPDDSLLDPSDDEQGNSPFNYTEEECKQMLADDFLDDQNSTGERALVTEDVSGQSEKEVSSNCTWASISPEERQASFRTIDELVSNESLPQTGSPDNPGYSQILENETSNSDVERCLNVDCLKSNQVIRTLFDCDLQKLINHSSTHADSVDQPKRGDCLEETGEKASQEIRDDRLQNESKLGIGSDGIRSNSLVVEEIPQCLTSKGQHSGGVDCVEKLPSETKAPSHFAEAHVKTSTYSPGPSCGQRKNKVEDHTHVLLLFPTTSNVALNQDPAKATDSGLAKTSGSQKEDLSLESISEESSDDLKLNSLVLGQNCGEEAACGKKLGKVIPVPQVEERPKQRICISEAELEQKKHIYIQCVRAHVKNSMDPTPDALSELYTLMNKVASREYQTQDRRWQHPSDLTMRCVNCSLLPFRLVFPSWEQGDFPSPQPASLHWLTLAFPARYVPC
uniref:S100P-binding protein n=1 Tax=Pelusios castaneus TaxID=367368 RepID=A0A8C8VGQ7_9SAUR